MNEKMDYSDTAYLSNVNSYIVFKFQDRVIRFKGPYSLIEIEKVKEWDNGYIVVDARYTHSPEPIEDYIDLVPILRNLYIEPDSFVKSIRKVEIKYVKSMERS